MVDHRLAVGRKQIQTVAASSHPFAVEGVDLHGVNACSFQRFGLFHGKTFVEGIGGLKHHKTLVESEQEVVVAVGLEGVGIHPSAV